MKVARIIDLTEDVINFLNGELLGDGYLFQRISKIHLNSVTFNVTDIHESYIKYLEGKLNGFGLATRNISTSKYLTKSGLKTKYTVSTITYAGATENLYNKWYVSEGYFCPTCEIFFPNDIIDILKQRDDGLPKYRCPACNEHGLYRKTIPKDLVLTPTTIRQWYVGDGCISSKHLVLNTSAFLHSDLQLLKQKLERLGFVVTIHKNRATYIWVESHEDFFKYIGDCPIKCYDYKWLHY